MSDLNDLASALKDTGTTGVTADAAKGVAMAIGLILSITATEGGIFILAAGTVVIETLVALGIFKQTDEVQTAVDGLGARFAALLGAESKQLLMLQVAGQISIARGARDFVRDNRPDDPNYAGQAAIALAQSKDAVVTLGNPAYWYRTYVEQADYVGYSASPSPPPFDEFAPLVFEYRLTLPAYLEAIVIRLVVLAALKPTAPTENQNEFSDLAETLATFYERIRDAVISVPAPDHPFPLNPTLSQSPLVMWDSLTRHCDAVELFSAYSISSTYPLQLWPPHHGNDTELSYGTNLAVMARQYDQFVPKYLLIELVEQKSVYRVLGLGGVLNAVNALRHLAGQDAIRDRAADLSMRQIRQLLGPLMPRVPVDPNNPAIKLKYSIGDIPRWLGVATDGARVSVRDLLESPTTWKDMSVADIEKELAADGP